ncbi:PLP-dependent aminotransferase family protein [Marinomonas piezotolerans]|uniref:PLP-dependent aminotransferase family protein n=2 Tax=Marinomonas piezotolerans TaxID=2213058 RepID=A0A370UBM6_9GAMM|nr:PLP-dependent aminotransferase family protein [Marinomonas piezotolerans]
MARAGTLIESVMSDIESKIASRAYLPNTRLPSVRAQAKAMNVSISTVVEAYDRLVAEGRIVSRPGAGFYTSGPIAPLNLNQIGPKVAREIDPLWVSRESLEARAGALMPGCGWLPSEWLYQTGIKRALRSLARTDSPDLTEYASPKGSQTFRHFLQRRLLNQTIDVTPDQIMLTESGTHAIDLIGRFLLSPGDTVLVDDPCYFNFHALLKAHRVQIVGVPYTPNGPDLEQFAHALETHNPRLYLTNSGIHNPTGAQLTPSVAHKLLTLAKASELVIVEDDIFADLESTRSPRLAAFDGLDQVIEIGSFSKTVSASVRCGYIAARLEWIEQLVDLKIATSFSGNRLDSEIVLQTLTDSGYRKHMDKLQTWLAKQRRQTTEKLTRLGIQPWIQPKDGMFLWCQLPDGVNATQLARDCLTQDVVLAPGNVFSQSQNAHDFLRFNVAQCTEPKIFEVLAWALKQQI